MDSIIGALLSSAVGAGLNFVGGQNQNQQNTAQSLLQDTYNMGMYNIGLRDNRANTLQAQNFSSQSQQTQNMFNAQQAADNRLFQNQSMIAAEQYNTSEAEKARAFNAKQQQAQNDWNLQTSSTAYQRASADMEKAGLNRILALGSPSPAQGASNASSPSPSMSPSPGSSASGSPVSSSAASVPQAASAAGMRFENVLSPAVSSAAQGASLFTDIQQKLAQTNLTHAQTQTEISNKNLTDAKTQSELKYPQKIATDTSNIAQNTQNSIESTAKTEKEIEDLKNQISTFRGFPRGGSIAGSDPSSAKIAAEQAAAAVEKAAQMIKDDFDSKAAERRSKYMGPNLPKNQTRMPASQGVTVDPGYNGGFNLSP